MSNPILRASRSSAPARQRGFTLVELMVATTIAVFLLGGLFVTVQSTRQAYGNQTALAQLQDNERLAMSVMANVIETAGYFPDPKLNTALTALPADAVFVSAGQSIIGTANAAAPGDTIKVRYAVGLAPADNALSCIGTTNTGVSGNIFINKFSVDATKRLICNFNGVDYPLIGSGVQKLAIGYGVKRGGAGTGSCTDTYLKSSEMTAADWTAICSVRVTLTFDNPLKRATGAQTIDIVRVIAVMGTAGVNS